MRLERFTLANSDQEIAINPEYVEGLAHVVDTDAKGVPVIGVTAIKVPGGAIVVKGAFGEVCQKLEGTHSRLAP